MLDSTKAITPLGVSEVIEAEGQRSIFERIVGGSKNLLHKLFPKKDKVSVAPPTEVAEIPSPSHDSDAAPLLSFEAMIEKISLQIWKLIRTHLKQMNLFQEDLENVYKASVKAQVRSYLSWTGTALQIAGVATSVCSLGVQLAPQKVGNALMKVRLFPEEWYTKCFQKGQLDLKGFSEAASTALQNISSIFGNVSKIHDNYSAADRTGADGQGRIAFGRSEFLQKKLTDQNEEKKSILQTLQKMYEEESSTRKAIGGR